MVMSTDLERSWSRASLDTWWVAKRYQVDDGAVTAADRDNKEWHTYHPFGVDNLPVEFAKLKDGDEAQILEFVNHRGLLGYDYLKDYEMLGSGQADDFEARDPVAWIHAHAKTVDMVLGLLDSKRRSQQKGDPSILADALIGQLVYEEMEGLKIKLPVIPYASGARNYRQHAVLREWDSDRPEVALAELLGDILEPNLDYLKRSHFIDDGVILRSFSFPSLLPVIYSHVDDAATGSKDYVQCEGCGNFFEQTHKSQRYCPHPNNPDDLESRCAIRGRNQKRARNRQKKSGAKS
jgi:hypothetical protein